MPSILSCVHVIDKGCNSLFSDTADMKVTPKCIFQRLQHSDGFFQKRKGLLCESKWQDFTSKSNFQQTSVLLPLRPSAPLCLLHCIIRL